MSEERSIFRKKTLERISSPEQLTDYLRVTNPGIWVLLIVILLLLGSLVAWAAIGTLETAVDVKVVVEDNTGKVIPTGGDIISGGMPLHVSGLDVFLASAETDEYGRYIGVAEVGLPDGIYDGSVVTEEIRPLDFLLESR